MPHSEIRSCGVVPSFYIKQMKPRTLLACSLIRHVFCFDQAELIELGQGESFPLLSPFPWLYTCDILWFLLKRTKDIILCLYFEQFIVLVFLLWPRIYIYIHIYLRRNILQYSHGDTDLKNQFQIFVYLKDIFQALSS